MSQIDLFGETIVERVDRKALVRSTYRLVAATDQTTPGCDDCRELVVPENKRAPWRCTCKITGDEVDDWRGTCGAVSL